LASTIITLPPSAQKIRANGRLFAGLAYSALLVSVFAYVLWFHLIRVCGATRASAYHFLMPLFGWLLLGERVEFADLVAILPVALGIYLVTHGASEAIAKAAALAADKRSVSCSP
jgi:drug/metabolite transporter (DMT)-like permease